jgi:hypothetical protein
MYPQFTAIVAPSPWTRTTGSGWAADGLQAKLFAPFGGDLRLIVADATGAVMHAAAAAHAAATMIVANRILAPPIRIPLLLPADSSTRRSLDRAVG